MGELSPFPSHDYPEYKKPSKQYENGPITYWGGNYRLPRPCHNNSDPKYEDSLREGGRVEASLTSKQYKSGRKYEGYLDGNKMYECI